jgi:hypothetical protein
VAQTLDDYANKMAEDSDAEPEPKEQDQDRWVSDVV